MVRRRTLQYRRIPKASYQSLWIELSHNGVWLKETRSGYQYMVGQYKITNKSISEAHCISTSTVKALAIWKLSGE